MYCILARFCGGGGPLFSVHGVFQVKETVSAKFTNAVILRMIFPHKTSVQDTLQTTQCHYTLHGRSKRTIFELDFKKKMQARIRIRNS